uniref:PDZ domain-containing protein n=1 Tax=Panagrolaimus superbus TaxID=310955 RepID=A0A914Z0S5_9BILA
MQRLILSFNRFEAIPVQFGDLKNLIELDISNNGIVDIAPEIEFSPHLVIIDLSSNVLSAGTLPKSIVNLSNLTHLNISNNPIAELPEDIDNLQNLRSLDARQCDLRQLPASIVKLRQLHRLDVGENNLAELPADFDGLENLREFDAEENDLIILSSSILGCTKLESLVISENRLRELPADIGELKNLIELNAHSNEIEKIPSSIRLLTNLRILRLNNNMIEMIPQALGSLSALNELYLNGNQLQAIPSSIGNLKKLSFLNISSNHITALPTTIGSLENLGSLLIRSNKLQELPSEIGKLTKLRILDIVDNLLEDLPYTLLVIKDTLRALYLTADRPMKIGALKECRDKNNIIVLSHYMLPQKNYTIPSGENKSTVGGSRVYFSDDVPPMASEEEINISQEDKGLGNFERFDTPHPKQFGQKYQKALQAKRNSQDMTGMFENNQNNGGTSEVDENLVQMRPLRSVLKTRPQSTISASMETGETKTVIVRRQNGTIGWNIYGGIDCRIPFKGTDHGFFVSKLEVAGAAEQSGIVIGDKLLAVNGRPLKGLTHDQCVNIIQDAGDLIEFRIESESAEKLLQAESKISVVSEGPPTSFAPPIPTKRDNEEPEVSTDVISVPIKCEFNGDPGFTICGGTASMPISIKDIIPHGPADSTGLLRPGDRILSVNGTNVKMARPEQVHALLKAVNADLELYLVVERVHFKSTQNLVQSLLAPSRSMPSLFLPHLTSDESQSAFTPYHVKQKSHGHARKPSGDFPANYFVDLTHEPRSAFGPNRSKSIDHLVLAVQQNSESKANQSFDCTALVSPKHEKSQSPKPSQLRQPNVFAPKKVISPPTTPISTPEPLAASSPAPTLSNGIQVASTSRIPQPSKIPPPVAPKPKTSITAKPQKPETLAFNSKIKRFEELQQLPSASTSTSTKNGYIPPPKKPLLSSSDLQKLKESEQLRMNNNTPKLAEEEDIDDVTPLEEYEQKLNYAVTTPSMPAIVRTKNAEMRQKAAEAAANGGVSPAPSSSSSSELQRSDSAASTSSLRKLDPQEIEKQKRWREARMKSVEAASLQAEGFLNELRQISRLSNISEDRSIQPSPIPTT